jgi:hypothetical protein
VCLYTNCSSFGFPFLRIHSFLQWSFYLSVPSNSVLSISQSWWFITVVQSVRILVSWVPRSSNIQRIALHALLFQFLWAACQLSANMICDTWLFIYHATREDGSLGRRSWFWGSSLSFVHLFILCSAWYPVNIFFP